MAQKNILRKKAKNAQMSETAFQTHVLSRLEHMEKDLKKIQAYIEDAKLSADDKRALRAALKEEKEGKLLKRKQVFA